ncbi:MAG TPA: hypothetical protein VFT43_05710 [Candidatus Polarisedimenticolia bacterium]|nr:hypothetical protein [Candidatus Polarisedimenticolia bacterium]
MRPSTALGVVLALLLSGAASRAGAPAPRSTPPASPPPPSAGQPGSPPAGAPDSRAATPGVESLDSLLKHLGEKAAVYEAVALRFVCIETIHSSEDPKGDRRFDFMYVEAQQQRYKPYRQRHTGRLARGVEDNSVNFGFPDSYSWTLMFAPDRQHLFRFRYVGQEWFSLRLANIIEFTAPLPFTTGQMIYEWGGRVWVDAENYNFLKVEAEPGNQTDRLKLELQSYRQAPRFLIFPMGKKPRGSRYNLTFLNEFQKLSLPDQAEFRAFTLDLEGQEEWAGQQTLRYNGYQFFNVDVKDKFLK